MHPTIAGMMHNYNKKFSELRIRNVCKLAGVKFYQLPSVKGFYSGNGKLHTCNIFTLKQFRNKLYKMVHFLPTDMEKSYPEKLVKMLSTEVAAAVTKPKGGKKG